MGGLLTSGASLVGAAIVALVLVCVAFVMPIRWLVFACFLIATVISGLLVYYTGIETFSWLPYFAVGLAYLRYLVWQSTRVRMREVLPRTKLPLFIVFALAFAVYTVAVSAISGTSASIVVGFKNYMAIWLIAFVVLSLRDNEVSMSQLERWLLWLSVLQVPVVVYQRLSTSNWDAYVGTFGGNPEGGGASGILMVFAIVAILTAVAMWQEKRLTSMAAAFFVLANIVVIGIAEVKGFFFLMPLALLVHQWSQFRRKPIESALIIIASLSAVYFLIGAYESIYATRGDYRERDVSASIANSLDYFFSTSEIDYVSGEVGRGASLALWWGDYATDLLHRLVGYGMGASRSSSTVAVGVVSQRFAPLNIDSTTLAQLLWDTGIIGAALFLSAVLTATLTAVRLASRERGGAQKSFLKMASGVLAMCIPLMIYDRSLLNHPTLQILLAMILAILCRCAMSAALSRGAPAVSAAGASLQAQAA